MGASVLWLLCVVEFGADGGSIAIAIIVDGWDVDGVSILDNFSFTSVADAVLIASVRALKWFRYNCEGTVFESAVIVDAVFDRRWSDVATGINTVVIWESLL